MRVRADELNQSAASPPTSTPLANAFTLTDQLGAVAIGIVTANLDLTLDRAVFISAAAGAQCPALARAAGDGGVRASVADARVRRQCAPK